MRDECYEFLKNEVGKVEIVGFGSCGEVKLARNTENGEIVAIKMVRERLDRFTAKTPRRRLTCIIN